MLDSKERAAVSGFRRVATVTALCCAFAAAADAQSPEARLREVLERIHSESRFPGAVLGAWRPGSAPITVAVGLADRERRVPMSPEALLHAGSAGKTLFAALALQLVAEGRVGLDDKVARYFARDPWYGQIPNADAITVRMLLDHTSGIPEYAADFMTALVRQPGQRRSPLDAVKSVAGAKPRNAAGAAFAYTDVNYQLLQLLTERITGRPAYSEIRRRLLEPLRLSGIVPADRKLIPGLVQGYAGKDSFMGFDAVMDQHGLKLDPAFEGGGGGFATNAGDLARWMGLFMQGKAFDPALLAQVQQGVPAGQLDVGKDARSGLGVEIVETPLGIAYGHGGFFPGYLTLVLWYAEPRIAVAIQVNSSAGDAVSRPLREVLLDSARAMVQ
jgi:D-alanyl-D-alanine carboxypeptidase